MSAPLGPSGRAPRRGLLPFLPFGLAVAEVVLFVLMVGWIGLGWTLLAAVATTVVGFWILRAQGLKAWREIRAEAERGGLGDPSRIESKVGATGAAMLSAVLLILPGFLTDALGLALLIPAVRRGLGRTLTAVAIRSVGVPGMPGMAGPRGSGAGRSGRGAPPSGSGPVVIEGEIVDDDRTPSADPHRDDPRHGRP